MWIHCLGVRIISFYLRCIQLLTLREVRYLPEWFPGVKFHEAAKLGLFYNREMRYVPYFETKKKTVSISAFIE